MSEPAAMTSPARRVCPPAALVALRAVRVVHRFRILFFVLVGVAATWPFAASAGQLPVANYSFTVNPSSNYAGENLTVLTNGTTQVSVWPNTADEPQLVGWNEIEPGIQFNFTGGQSVSEVTIWAANSKGSAGVWLPVSVTVTSGSFSKTLLVTPPDGSGTTTPLTITSISAAGDSFTITANRYTASAPNGWTMLSEVQFFGTGAKDNNTNALNLATSWTGEQAPVATDVVLFNTTYNSTTALDTGAAVDWAGLKVTGGSGTLTIDPTTSANRLGIGSSGIDLSGATRDVRLTDLRLTGSTAQAWSIAPGRSLSVGADSLAQDTGAVPTVSGSGTLVKEGASTGLTIGSLTSFTGTLSVQAGSVTTTAANQLTENFGVNLAAGGTLRLSGNETLPTNMSGLGVIEILQSNTVTISNASDRTVEQVFSGTGGLLKNGTGTLTLSGTNTYSGGTVVSAGTLVGTAASLQGNIANASALVFDDAAGGTFAGAISGAGSLTKSGVGNLVLSGSNSYTGPTSISAGRLSVNGSLASSAVTVSGGTLGGTGTLAGTVAVQAGGRVSPGNSIGVLTQGDTTFDVGAIFKYEVDSSDLDALANAADLLVVNGALNIAAGTLLEFSDLAAQAQGFVQDTTVFAMINYTGNWDGGLFTYNSQTLTNGSRFMAGSQLWEIDYAYVYNTATPGSTVRPLNFQGSHLPATGTQTFVAVTAVPEPSTYAMALAGLACGGYVVRRRRKRA